MKDIYLFSNIDDFLEKEGTLAESDATVVKRVITVQSDNK